MYYHLLVFLDLAPRISFLQKVIDSLINFFNVAFVTVDAEGVVGFLN